MKTISFEFGIEVLEVESWDDFLNFMTLQLDYPHFIWRGQSDSSWKLCPSLDRLLDTKAPSVRRSHLENFKYASRGRLDIDPNSLTENEWWAIGQHHGLPTPLLDWTRSPFVAVYFAFGSNNKSTTSYRSIFGVSQSTFERISRKIKKNFSGEGRPPIIEFIEPLTNNPRLVSQGGIFSRSPDGIDIESWLRKNNSKEDKNIRFHKIDFPDNLREVALRFLNRMNINHLSLFPDLYGASKYCAMDLEIDKY